MGNVFSRLLHRPHSIRQRVTISADDSPELIKAGEAIAAMKAILDQYSADGTSNHYNTRTVFGMESLEADTPLFTHQNNRGPYKEIELPANIDPTGALTTTIRQRVFCHTTDNTVQFCETDSAFTWP